MADAPASSTSVTTTGTVAVSTGAGLIVLQYLVHPMWPPPEPVLTIFATALVPVVHMLGKALMGRLTKVASDIDPTDDVSPAPTVVVNVPPPAPPPAPTVAAPPAVSPLVSAVGAPLAQGQSA